MMIQYHNRRKQGEEMERKKIALTGHRPSKLLPEGEKWDLSHPLIVNYGKAIRRELLKQAGFNTDTQTWDMEQPVQLISGMALGIDTIGALVLIRLKTQFPDLFFLECAIPCAKHESLWPQSEQKRYHEILEKADDVTHVSKKTYDNTCMQRRNEYMVDEADVILAVWDGSKSGTGNCVVYALEKGKPITLIEPISLRVGALS